MKHANLRASIGCAQRQQGRNVAMCAQSAQREPRQGNVEGQFYVDHTCINCDTCRWMAPSSFSRVGNGSSVTSQPETREERIAAMQATVSCPTMCTATSEAMGLPCTLDEPEWDSCWDSAELREALAGIPIPVEGCEGIYHLGYHSEKSFGATSYLIQRPEGNIMMDSPRFSPALAKLIEKLGGVKHIVLSHIDDISDHDKWAAHFNAPRIMHSDEIRRSISDIEIQLKGHGPWDLEGNTLSGKDELVGGVQLVHVPGHTSGCISLWHEATKTMFTGDHLGYSERVGRISIFPRYNRAGISQQLDSVQKLLDYDFYHVLPGHGRRFHLSSAEERLQMVSEVVESEKQMSMR